MNSFDQLLDISDCLVLLDTLPMKLVDSKKIALLLQISNLLHTAYHILLTALQDTALDVGVTILSII